MLVTVLIVLLERNSWALLADDAASAAHEMIGNQSQLGLIKSLEKANGTQVK